MTPKQLQDLIVLARTVIAQYELNTYSTRVLNRFYRAIKKAENEIYAHIRKQGARLKDYDETRQLALLDEFQRLTVGIRAELIGDVSEIAGEAAIKSAFDMNNIGSFDGRVSGWNFVELHPEQIRAFIQTTPVGGKLLSDWVTRSFNVADKGKIREEITAGALRGQGHRQLVERLRDNVDLTRREAITLSRTYVQVANNEAHRQVYKANRDIVKAVRWTSALETGSKKSGRGTCIQCAVLDGQKFANSDESVREGLPDPPECPLHPRCIVDPHTEILVDNQIGFKSIKDIKIGDRVLTHKNRYKKVIALSKVKLNTPVITIVLDCKLDNDEYPKIEVTPDHPLCCNFSWVLAKNLKLYDEIPYFEKTLFYAEIYPIRSLTYSKSKYPVTVYNFSVEDDESYIANGFVSHNCRCVLVPVTSTFKEMGIDIDEIEGAYRPYYDRGAIKNGEKVWKNIDEGGRAAILETGFRKGNYKDFFWDMTEKQKLDLVGPKRLELLSETGKIQFKDLTDKNGRLRTLEELKNLK